MLGGISKRSAALTRRAGMVAALLSLPAGVAGADPITSFTPGDIVVSVEGDGSGTGTYTDNQAAPLTLYEYGVTGTSSASLAGTLELPQTTVGSNSAISGEYGSSSEGMLQLSGNGQYLTIAGYGVNANTFNANPQSYGGGTKSCIGSISPCYPLGQTASVPGTPGSAGSGVTTAIVVPRVIALIGSNGSVDTSTSLTGVFNENNPRSVFTQTGTSFYISGQGTGNTGDTSGGVFYVPSVGSTTAIPITGQDALTNVSQDTRDVQIVNNTLYVSADTKEGSNSARDFIGTLGAPGSPPTSLANGGNGPAMLPGIGNTGGTGKVTITTGPNSDGNGLNAGDQINLSPEGFFFANSTTLYIADSGSPKNDSNATKSGVDLGDGGLQKWSLVNGTWVLDYTLSAGLGLVDNATDGGTSGTTGLEGLTGEVVGDEVELFATNFTIGDLDPSFLFGITDMLGDTTNPGDEAFTELAAAPADSNFKGVAFAPAPEPSSLAILCASLVGLGLARRRRRNI